MPCRDGREDDIEEDNRHMRAGAELLCTWVRRMEEVGGITFIPIDIQLWWAEHKRRDAR